MKKLLIIVVVLSLLTGCWDKTSLDQLLMVDVIGLDKDKDSKQLKESLLVSRLLDAHQGGGKPSTVLISASGNSLYETYLRGSLSIPGILVAVQCRLYLLSKEMAKNKPMEALSVLGRFPESPLIAHIVVYDGDLPKLLAKKKIKEETVNNFLVDLVVGEGKINNIPDDTLIRYILGGDAFLNDFMLPLLAPKGDGVEVVGGSLFSDGNYTGQDLSMMGTKLALLMKGSKGAGQQVYGQQHQTEYTFIVQKAKRKVLMHSKGNQLQGITIPVHLDVKLMESGPKSARPMSSSEVNKLEQEIAADLTSQARKAIVDMQKVNCDYMQLGQELHAYHPKLWKPMNWRKDYPRMTIQPKFSVRVLNTGVIVP
ncbi:Ger(x)C family spore germination protein [Paenibacillus sp. BC26]|uniref:Ger(x)C family spore germination protein n=1 Tax=Paenibacillus sp. BC26 TaxID=1881032 RepID=UPI0008E3A16A|nr:Ger(x)C family spore germination protein [Paenibacillus sp. BC26]SFS45942.1 germination protein, Ger(x)C family [Paenibacillus sp. BC26]